MQAIKRRNKEEVNYEKQKTELVDNSGACHDDNYGIRVVCLRSEESRSRTRSKRGGGYSLTAVDALNKIINSVYEGPEYYFSIEAAAAIDFTKLQTGGEASALEGRKFNIDVKINLDTDPNKDFLSEGSDTEIYLQIAEEGKDPIFGIYYNDDVNQRPGIGIVSGNKKYYVPATSLGLMLATNNNEVTEDTDLSGNIVASAILAVVISEVNVDESGNSMVLVADMQKIFKGIGELLPVLQGLLGEDINDFFAGAGLALTAEQILAISPQIKVELSASFDDIKADRPALKNIGLHLTSARDEEVKITTVDGQTLIDFTIPTMDITAAVSKLAVKNGEKVEITMPDMSEWQVTNALNLDIGGQLNLLSDKNALVHTFEWKLVSNIDPFLMMETNFLLDDPIFKENKNYLHFQVYHTCTEEEKADSDSWCSRRMAYSDGAILDIFYDPISDICEPHIYVVANIASLIPKDYLIDILTSLVGDMGGMLIQAFAPLFETPLILPFNTQAFNQEAPVSNATETTALDINSILSTVKTVIKAFATLDFSDGLTVDSSLIKSLAGESITDPILGDKSIFDIILGVLDGTKTQKDAEGNIVNDENGNPVLITDNVSKLQFKINSFKFGEAGEYDAYTQGMLIQPDGSERAYLSKVGTEILADMGLGNFDISLGDVALLDLAQVGSGYGLIATNSFAAILGGAESTYISGDFGESKVSMMASEVYDLKGKYVYITYRSIDGTTKRGSAIITGVIGFNPNELGEQTVKLQVMPIDGNTLATAVFSLLNNETITQLLGSLGDIDLSSIFFPGDVVTTKIHIVDVADENILLATGIPENVEYVVGDVLTGSAVDAFLTGKITVKYTQDGSDVSTQMKANYGSCTGVVDPQFMKHTKASLDGTTASIEFMKAGTAKVSFTAFGITKTVDVKIVNKADKIAINDFKDTVELGKGIDALGSGITIRYDENNIETIGIDYLEDVLTQKGIMTKVGDLVFFNKLGEIKFSFTKNGMTSEEYTFTVVAPQKMELYNKKTSVNVLSNVNTIAEGITVTFADGTSVDIVGVLPSRVFIGDSVSAVTTFPSVGNVSVKFEMYGLTSEVQTVLVIGPSLVEITSNYQTQVKLGTYNSSIGINMLKLTFQDGTVVANQRTSFSDGSYDNTFFYNSMFVKPGIFTYQPKAFNVLGEAIEIEVLEPDSVEFVPEQGTLFENSDVFDVKFGSRRSSVGISVVFHYASGNNTINYYSLNADSYVFTDLNGNLADVINSNDLFVKAGKFLLRVKLGVYQSQEYTVNVQPYTVIEKQDGYPKTTVYAGDNLSAMMGSLTYGVEEGDTITLTNWNTSYFNFPENALQGQYGTFVLAGEYSYTCTINGMVMHEGTVTVIGVEKAELIQEADHFYVNDLLYYTALEIKITYTDQTVRYERISNEIFEVTDSSGKSVTKFEQAGTHTYHYNVFGYEFTKEVEVRPAVASIDVKGFTYQTTLLLGDNIKKLVTGTAAVTTSDKSVYQESFAITGFNANLPQLMDICDVNGNLIKAGTYKYNYYIGRRLIKAISFTVYDPQELQTNQFVSDLKVGQKPLDAVSNVNVIGADGKALAFTLKAEHFMFAEGVLDENGAFAAAGTYTFSIVLPELGENVRIDNLSVTVDGGVTGFTVPNADYATMVLLGDNVSSIISEVTTTIAPTEEGGTASETTFTLKPENFIFADGVIDANGKFIKAGTYSYSIRIFGTSVSQYRTAAGVRKNFSVTVYDLAKGVELNKPVSELVLGSARSTNITTTALITNADDKTQTFALTVANYAFEEGVVDANGVFLKAGNFNYTVTLPDMFGEHKTLTGSVAVYDISGGITLKEPAKTIAKIGDSATSVAPIALVKDKDGTVREYTLTDANFYWSGYLINKTFTNDGKFALMGTKTFSITVLGQRIFSGSVNVYDVSGGIALEKAAAENANVGEIVSSIAPVILVTATDGRVMKVALDVTDFVFTDEGVLDENGNFAKAGTFTYTIVTALGAVGGSYSVTIA